MSLGSYAVTEKSLQLILDSAVRRHVYVGQALPLSAEVLSAISSDLSNIVSMASSGLCITNTSILTGVSLSVDGSPFESVEYFDSIDDAMRAAANQNFDRDMRLGLDPTTDQLAVYMEEARYILDLNGENYVPDYPDHTHIKIRPKGGIQHD